MDELKALQIKALVYNALGIDPDKDGATISQDANGSAVVTLADGKAITLVEANGRGIGWRDNDGHVLEFEVYRRNLAELNHRRAAFGLPAVADNKA